jgi:hypothetical protein
MVATTPPSMACENAQLPLVFNLKVCNWGVLRRHRHRTIALKPTKRRLHGVAAFGAVLAGKVNSVLHSSGLVSLPEIAQRVDTVAASAASMFLPTTTTLGPHIGITGTWWSIAAASPVCKTFCACNNSVAVAPSLMRTSVPF